VNSENSTDAPLPLAEEEEREPPTEERVLRHLALTLSVSKTFKRFPSIRPKDLQEILTRSAQRAKEDQDFKKDLPSLENSLEFFIHADGASRGNPGEAGVGIVIADPQGRTVKEWKQFIGVATNNVAEYSAVLIALEKALDLGAQEATLFLDSELVARQLQGEYRVREDHLKALHRQVITLLNRLTKYAIHAIPREENRRADQLANEAIDQRKK
jgi:ribonuclease HI